MSLWNGIVTGTGDFLGMCFNPCFRGCRSGTLPGHRPRRGREGVSILVFVDVALERLPPLPPMLHFHVSILVFVDVALELCCYEEEESYDEFQSLFSWMSLWNRRGYPSGSCGTSFNPCFRGCRSGTKKAVPYRCRFENVSILVFVDVALEPAPARLFNNLSRFQSLFSWMSLWNWNFYLRRVLRGEFQSLFSWMSLWNATEELVSGYRCQFQSLFSWMSLWNVITGNAAASDCWVSILVFVDVALEHEIYGYEKE